MAESPLDLPRCSGVLLHLTSLPGPGIGDLGDAAHRWVDWLADAGQTVWQILPLVPVNEGGSPYNGLSAFAGNPLLLSPRRLADDGLLRPEQLAAAPQMPADRVDFVEVVAWKERLLDDCHAAFRSGAARRLRSGFAAFRAANRHWLDDYALFRALREAHHGASWAEWDEPVRRRQEAALRHWRERLAERVDAHAFREFLFQRQWDELHAHARARGVRIMGDIPIFVAYDSADVWAHQEIFHLGDDGRPTVVAGVPPDYFSATGQRWGNPLYRWDVMQERGFRWWAERFRRTLEQVDIVRVDHFRGFEAYWEIPADAETAVRGQWRPGPRDAFFHALQARLGALPIVAEDLGLITPEVDALRERLGFPGMRVLQFAFDGDPLNPHLPANYPERTVAYTGTHDNATLVEWWARAPAAERARADRLVGDGADGVHWRLMRLVFESMARLALVPLQDLLGLGAEGRMNTPGTGPGNWAWRLPEERLDPELQRRLLELSRATGRARQAAVHPVSQREQP